MKKRYVLALVVVEQVLDEEGGNGAWLNHKQIEWSLVDDFGSEEEAREELKLLDKKYRTGKN